MEPRAVRRLSESDAEGAGEVLTRAFLGDGPFTYAIPSRTDQERLCPPYHAAYLRYSMHLGEVWGCAADHGTLVGVIAWMPAPRPEMTPEQSRRWGIDASNAAWGAAHDRLEAEEQMVSAVLPTVLPEPCRHVGVLGVDPAQQGNGVGSALVGHVLDQARVAGLPVSTWTAASRNVSFYQRAGFEIVTEGIFPGSGLPWWGFLTPTPARQ